jgi:hypothetical protein
MAFQNATELKTLILRKQATNSTRKYFIQLILFNLKVKALLA